MNNKILYIGVVIALLLGGLGIVFPKTDVQRIIQEVKDIVSNLGGSVHNTRESFDEGIAGNGVTGNGCLVMGITASTSISATDFCNSSCVTLDPYGTSAGLSEEGASISLPTSATMIVKCLPNVGDSKTVIFENIATASGRNFEFTTYGSAENDYELFLNGGTALSSGFTELQIVRAIHTTGATVSYQVIESTGD